MIKTSALIFSLCGTVMLVGCQTLSQPASQPITSDTATLWVDGQTKPCSAGAGRMQCLQVVQGDVLSTQPQWQNFYAPIAGFVFQDGVRQKIVVQKTPLDPSQVPADASSIDYKLIKVLQKQPMPKPTNPKPTNNDNNTANLTRLHDIWAVTHINAQAITPAPHQEVPSIEFHVADKKVMGTDGCNHFSGNLATLDAQHMTFGTLASTRKMCFDMTIADQFNHAMQTVSSYQLDGLTLILRNEQNQEVLRLKKVD